MGWLDDDGEDDADDDEEVWQMWSVLWGWSACC